MSDLESGEMMKKKILVVDNHPVVLKFMSQLLEKQAHQALKLVEELEDHDDVQTVAANFDIDEKEIERLSQA
jgi:transcriptional/translational regulatory protein YebC/TACO1